MRGLEVQRARLVVIAAAVTVLLVVPIAVVAASGSGSAQATASSSISKQLKKLKKQVTALKKQVDELKLQPGPQGPAGPSTGPADSDPAPFRFSSIGTTSVADIVTVKGLVLRAGCTTGSLQFEARTATNNAYISGVTTDEVTVPGTTVFGDNDFDIGEVIPLENAIIRNSGRLTYARSGGDQVVVEFGTVQGAANLFGEGIACLAFGQTSAN